ncbi:MAG: DUF1587 domain-containing protein, partial [Gemmatimonadota bacterium]|nr:DUF1587 domain-containing protein [Gemmatimonadota bacterium]
MKTFSVLSAMLGVILVSLGDQYPETTRADLPASVIEQGAASSNDVIQQYCVRCHNDSALRGNMTLEQFDLANAEDNPELTEKMISKVRAGMMPPPGARRPAGDTLRVLAEELELHMDGFAARSPNPGSRTFQRLNRSEYESAVFDLLGLEVDAGAYLPLDTKSENFDNIADVQLLSPT